MSETNRGYSTWEEDFLTERCELHGFNGELVAIVDTDNGCLFYVERADGYRMLTGINFLAAKAGQLKSDLEFAVIDRDRFIDRSSRYLDKIQKQRRIIAVLAVALLVAAGIIAR